MWLALSTKQRVLQMANPINIEEILSKPCGKPYRGIWQIYKKNHIFFCHFLQSPFSNTSLSLLFWLRLSYSHPCVSQTCLKLRNCHCFDSHITLYWGKTFKHELFNISLNFEEVFWVLVSSRWCENPSANVHENMSGCFLCFLWFVFFSRNQCVNQMTVNQKFQSIFSVKESPFHVIL